MQEGAQDSRSCAPFAFPTIRCESADAPRGSIGVRRTTFAKIDGVSGQADKDRKVEPLHAHRTTFADFRQTDPYSGFDRLYRE